MIPSIVNPPDGIVYVESEGIVRISELAIRYAELGTEKTILDAQGNISGPSIPPSAQSLLRISVDPPLLTPPSNTA